MRETLEKLWDEYFAEECAVLRTEEERALVKKAAELQKTADASLTKEQSEVVQKHMEALYEMQGFFVKKAFFKGCEFATSFLLEVKILGRR